MRAQRPIDEYGMPVSAKQLLNKTPLHQPQMSYAFRPRRQFSKQARSVSSPPPKRQRLKVLLEASSSGSDSNTIFVVTSSIRLSPRPPRTPNSSLKRKALKKIGKTSGKESEARSSRTLDWIKKSHCVKYEPVQLSSLEYEPNEDTAMKFPLGQILETPASSRPRILTTSSASQVCLSDSSKAESMQTPSTSLFADSTLPDPLVKVSLECANSSHTHKASALEASGLQVQRTNQVEVLQENDTKGSCSELHNRASVKCGDSQQIDHSMQSDSRCVSALDDPLEYRCVNQPTSQSFLQDPKDTANVMRSEDWSETDSAVLAIAFMYEDGTADGRPAKAGERQPARRLSEISRGSSTQRSWLSGTWQTLCRRAVTHWQGWNG